MQVWRAIGIAVVAPALIYLLIFHHWRCDTLGEQIMIGVLAPAGFAAAVKWA